MFSCILCRNILVHTYENQLNTLLNLIYKELVIPSLRYSPVVAKGNNQEMRRQKFLPNIADWSWKAKPTVRIKTCLQDLLPT